MRRYSWILVIIFFAACGPIPTVLPIPTVDNTAIVIQAAATANTQLTQISTLQPRATIAPTLPAKVLASTQTPPPVATPGKSFLLDSLRVVYIKNGDLYLQDGVNQPLQLTHSGKSHNPIISDDGKKIVFYHGKDDETVNSINVDGSGEKTIVISEKLPLLGRGTIKFLTFRPGSHEVFFSTFLCEAQNALYVFNYCSVNIFFVDADTGETTELLTGLSGDSGQGRNFEVSPNGQFLSVAVSGHIDILYNIVMGAKPDILKDQVTYIRTKPNEYLPLQYWLPDSSGLIAVLPNDEYNDPTSPPYTYIVWRYTMMHDDRPKEDASIQIPLELPITNISGCNFSVSPDRNWIFFTSDGNGKGIGTPSYYLGNLNNGQTHSFNNIPCPTTYEPSTRWSLDSRYIVGGYYDGNFAMGTIEGQSSQIEGQFIDWIDATHYFYAVNEKKVLKTYIQEVGGKTIPLSEDFTLATFILLKPKTDK